MRAVDVSDRIEVIGLEIVSEGMEMKKGEYFVVRKEGIKVEMLV